MHSVLCTVLVPVYMCRNVFLDIHSHEFQIFVLLVTVLRYVVVHSSVYIVHCWRGAKS